MTNLTDELSAALMEQRDNVTFALATVHRTHAKLLDILVRMEQRLETVENLHRVEGEDFDDRMTKWMHENIGTLAATLTNVDDFNNHIESIAQETFDSKIEDVTVDIDVSASLR